MSNKKDRGAKRKCQNEACALPFYDLNRTEFACPTCGTAFDIKAAQDALSELHGKGLYRKTPRRFPATIAAAEVDPAPAELADGEVADDAVVKDAIPEGDSDVILEQEDDSDATIEIEQIADEPKDD